MGIQTGIQLLAPEGYALLEKGVTYYFLKSDAYKNRVLLVRFVIREPRAFKPKQSNRIKRISPVPFPILVIMGREHFETGIEKKVIIPAAVQHSMPPWLRELEGLNIADMDRQRSNPKQLHADRIDARLSHIYPLVERANDIFQLKNPDIAINHHARTCVPKQNETKLRQWFYTYMIFGRNRAALHYPVHRIGNWSRAARSTEKRGAPSKRKGKGHGWNADAAMREKIMEGYYRFSGLGKTIAFIYRSSMIKIFGCKSIRGKNGNLEYFHPDGQPFPTQVQFRYHVKQKIGAAKVTQTAIGKGRERQEVLPETGKFTACVANLMERTEADGYYFEEVPKGYLEDSPLPPLCMVRIRDYASGALIGIGFAQNAERASAYRMAQFCAAIDKVKFCSLFGIEIKPETWPMISVAPFLNVDRGPGSSMSALAEDLDFQPIFRELPPAYMGQSKAVVESSHPKTMSNSEAPSFIQSNLTPIEMVGREIRRLIKDNDAIDISSRITPDLIGKVSRPTPLALWNTLDALGRNDGIQMSFDDAVRNFLTPIEVIVKTDAVYFHGQPFHSTALKSTKLLNLVARGQKVKVPAYCLDACVRHIWIEVHGRIIELNWQAALRSQDSVYYRSLDELKEQQRIANLQESAHSEHRSALESDMMQRFEEETGKAWDSGSRRSGKPKRGTPIARKEATEADRMMRGRSKP